MRVVFMGTPEFAVPSLEMLLRRHDVVAVYTRPDSGSGRGRRIAPSPVKARALDAGCVVQQPPSLRAADVVDTLGEFAPDIVVVAAYGLILPPDVLSVPANGCVNVHASLLPRWRGAAPVQRAILAGDETTGVSIMRMEAGLDTGPFARRVEVRVGDLGAAELTAALALSGAAALEWTLDAIGVGTVEWTEQDDECATYADKVSATDVALDPSLEVVTAIRRVRASSPSAPCRAVVEGRRVTVLDASIADSDVRGGEARCGKGLVLGFADGALRLERLVPEGRKAMTGEEYARGARLAASCEWAAS